MEALILNLYFELLKTPVFTVEDVNKYYDNMDSARSAIKRLMKEGMVAKIRNNMYTCISGETGAPVANRFQIASKITPTSYVSHHTAMEYYGITDQVYYDVYVASETSFREFEFDGYTYRYVASKDMEGVETPALSGGIRITNRERTLVDCVKDMDKSWNRRSDTGYWKYEANAGEKSLEIFRPIIESVPIPKDGISSF